MLTADEAAKLSSDCCKKLLTQALQDLGPVIRDACQTGSYHYEPGILPSYVVKDLTETYKYRVSTIADGKHRIEWG